jgi:thiosulfate/3-mercaptopyruvate sulfurtransferase
MAFTTLIDAETVTHQLGDPAVVIVDTRFDLRDDAWGEGQYLSGHIPGAVYAHLNRDLSGTRTGSNGRHPLPDADSLTQTLGRLGIDANAQVVIYDQDNGMFASRLWWLLRWLGHDAAAILDGGFARWTAGHRPVVAGHHSREPRRFSGAPRPQLVVDAKEVDALRGRSDWRLIDARAPERYRGEIEPIDRVPGHIPGAVNYFYKNNVDERGVFLSPNDLRTRLQEAIGNVDSDHVVCYCGSGVTACQNLLALEHAGIRGARLYPGSWSEWSSDPKRPVER